MFSIQRKNRDYPGMVVIRNKEGNFVRDTGNKIFSVPQLARSMSNLPGYLTNGNTPEGIFKMHGFSVSLNKFIGPSPNIQLSLPVEMRPQQFLRIVPYRTAYGAGNFTVPCCQKSLGTIRLFTIHSMPGLPGVLKLLPTEQPSNRSIIKGMFIIRIPLHWVACALRKYGMEKDWKATSLSW